MTQDEAIQKYSDIVASRKHSIINHLNILGATTNPTHQNDLCKCIIIVIYSHLEGAIKDSFKTHIKYINSQNISRHNITPSLLEYIIYQKYKNKIKDSGLSHQVCKEMLQTIQQDEPVHIDENTLFNGMKFDYKTLEYIFKTFNIKIPTSIKTGKFIINDRLKIMRNKYVHGELSDETIEIDIRITEEMRDFIFNSFDDTENEFCSAISNKTYLKIPP